MQIATDSILAARTELKFTDQGIIAIDKSDHNKMVILNSAGLGVSTDGGQTFKTAITAESIDGQNINIKNLNASNIVGGIINGITYNTVDDDTNFRITLQKGMMEYYYDGNLLGGLYATNDPV
jgi:mannitol-specific phosphotransferase system IIBC component